MEDKDVRMVYGHVDSFRGNKLLIAFPSQFPNCKYSDLESTWYSENKNLMSSGVSLTFFQGRLLEGKGQFLQPDGSYEKFQVPISHPEFNSLLHLGAGRYANHSMINRGSNPQKTSVTLQNKQIGEQLYKKGFPKGIESIVEYVLENRILTRIKTITNNSRIHMMIPSSDHGSYMPDLGRAEDLTVKLYAPVKLELDFKSGTKAATGKIASTNTHFGEGYIINIKDLFGWNEPLEGMYLVTSPVAEIVNQRTDAGLKITGDPKSKVAYFWVPADKSFVSIQFYDGPPTGALYLPQTDKILDIFRQKKEDILAPGQSKTYTQTFQAIKGHSK